VLAGLALTACYASNGADAEVGVYEDTDRRGRRDGGARHNGRMSADAATEPSARAGGRAPGIVGEGKAPTVLVPDAGLGELPRPGGGAELCRSEWPLATPGAVRVQSPAVDSGLASERGGNTVVALTLSGAITVGDETFTPSGERDGLVIEIDRACNLLWARKLTAVPDDAPGGAAASSWLELGPIAIDIRGNVFLAATFFADAPPETSGIAGGSGVRIIKLTTDGELAWATNFSFDDRSVAAVDVAVDIQDHVYVAIDLPFLAAWSPAGPGDGGDRIGLARLDGADGYVQWTQRIVGSQLGVNIAVNRLGTLTVLGTTRDQRAIGTARTEALNPPLLDDQGYLLSIGGGADAEPNGGALVDPLGLGLPPAGASLASDDESLVAMWQMGSASAGAILSVAKYAGDDSLHPLRWEQPLLTASEDALLLGHTALASDGAVLTSAAFGGSVQLAREPVQSQGASDVFVEKRTRDGAVAWRAILATPEVDDELGLSVDRTDVSVLVLSESASTLSVVKLAL
jgi:hypothetical protein